MNNILKENFRKELLRVDVIPRKLNEISLKYKKLLLEDLNNKVIETEDVVKCQCGSGEFDELTKIDRYGLPFGSLICKFCGLILTNPIIKQKSLPYYYDKYYHALNYGKESLENQSALFGVGQGKKIFNILEGFLSQKNIINLLEIGAGTGNVLSEFKKEAKEKNIKVEELGTEYSTDCINKCKNDGINVIEGDINTVLKLNKKFDVIILSHVFEHFIYLAEELKKLKKLMSSDTLLYIEVPGLLVNHKKDYYDYSFLGYLVHAHIYNFTFSSLENILELNGFSLLYGNEEVEVVCKLNENKEKKIINNDYTKILNYLEFLYQNKDYFSNINNENKQNKILLKKKEDMVFNRDQDIKKKSEQLENRKKDIEKYQSMVEFRDQDIKKKSEQLENRKKDIEKYQSMVEFRDQDIKKKSEQLENRKKDIEKYQSMVEFRDQEIKKKSEQLENRKKDIEKYQSMVEFRDQDIKKKSEQLENRKKDIEKYQSMIEFRDQKIKKILVQLEEAKEEICDINDNLEDCKLIIENRDKEIVEFKNSIKSFTKAGLIEKISLYKQLKKIGD